jgi:hypothetical protein
MIALPVILLTRRETSSLSVIRVPARPTFLLLLVLRL